MEFKVNDRVKVINDGATYSTYRDWVTQYVCDDLREKWNYGKSPNKNHTFVIKVIAPHQNGWDIAYIQSENNGTCYIIGFYGLEKTHIQRSVTNDNNEPIICDICGCVIENDEYTEFDGKIYCEDCRDEELAICDDCGELTYRADMIWLDGYDKHICDDCFDGNYTRCADCDTIVSYDDAYYTYHDEHICSDCRDYHYYPCENCGELVHEDCIEWDGDYPYCPNCYENIIHSGIHDYNYKPEPIFYNNGDNKDNLYMGIELELDKGGENNENAEQILSVANDIHEHIYIKHDGSLDCGFEIVSHPCTLEYHENNLQWREIMTKALSLEYRSHDTATCGLHIHISRRALGDNYDERENTIAKIVFFVEKYWNSVLKFTRRTEERMARWASRYGIEPTIKDTYNKAKGSYDRYKCINLQNEDTVEFRMFRGTLKYSTFIATLQFVNTLVKYCIGNDNLSWEDYVSNIDGDTYKELVEYLTEKELLHPVELDNETVVEKVENNNESLASELSRILLVLDNDCVFSDN